MKKRKTLGLLIKGLDGNYLTYIWLMIKKAAEEFDCNLIVYEGKTIKSKIGDDAKHTIVYGFVDKPRLDGIILTSAISDELSEEELANFLHRYKDIPMVSMGRVVPNVPSILVDGKEGMKSAVKHLIEDHGYRKIAFVTGPKNNDEAMERYQAYVEVLEENNIELDEDIVFEGSFNSQDGYRIMENIIKNDIDYDAIVFSNDDMALGSIKAIGDLSEKYKFDASKKITMCGFDDSINSKLTTPSLTTVRQPIEELCYNAVKTLIEKIDGKETFDIMKFPAILVRRQSCGCEGEKALDEISNKYLRLTPDMEMTGGVETYSLKELYNKITFMVKRFGIRSFFISTYYEGAIKFIDTDLLDKSYTVPEKSELIYAFYNFQREEIQDSIKIYNTKDIVPDYYLPKDRRFIYLVAPLYFDEENFGFLCTEISNDDIFLFEGLRSQISNTLKGALTLKEKDEMEKILLEKERLASLGQLVGGISHNLMSPISAISEIQETLESLINKQRELLEDKKTTIQEKREIINTMRMCNEKIKKHNSYISKMISTIKNQTTQLNCTSIKEFTIEELLGVIKYSLKNNEKLDRCNLNIEININVKTRISGDIRSLAKIIDNLLINGIQAYDENNEKQFRIDLSIYLDKKSIIFKVRDYGRGLSEDVKDKIFKHMVTTRDKDGTGTSLLLSYSTIKGRFGGEMWFEEGKEKGSVFYISIPVRKL